MNTIDITEKHIFSDPEKRRAWVLFQVKLQGRSLAQIGKENGIATRQNIYETFRRPYPRIEKIIAEAVGLTAQELFPERYGPDGLPNRPMGRPKKSLIPKH